MKTEVKLTKNFIDPTHFAVRKESTTLHCSNQNTSRVERTEKEARKWTKAMESGKQFQERQQEL